MIEANFEMTVWNLNLDDMALMRRFKIPALCTPRSLKASSCEYICHSISLYRDHLLQERHQRRLVNVLTTPTYLIVSLLPAVSSAALELRVNNFASYTNE